MQKEFLHLSYLLTKHECVILPGFGAFVVHSASQPVLQRNGIFSAPFLSLGFNPELVHNDGILVHSIMKERQISYNEANLQVQKFIEELIACLKIKQEVMIPKVGKLSQSGENRIIFTPAADELTCNAVYYGLSDFHMPSLAELNKWSVSTESPQQENKDIVHITFSRKVLKTVASVAACALIFFLFSTPFDDHRMPVQNASMFSLIKSQYAEREKNAENTLTEQEAPVTETHEETKSEIKVEPAVKTMPVVASEIAEPSRLYYIIIASLPTRQSAENELVRVVEKHYVSAGIIGNDKRYRIYVEKFADKMQAETYLEKLRGTNSNYKDAWVFSNKEKI